MSDAQQGALAIALLMDGIFAFAVVMGFITVVEILIKRNTRKR